MTKIRKPLEEIPDVDILGLRLPFVCTVDDVLAAEECQALIERVEAQEPVAATITRGNGVFEMNKRVRNNDRVMMDDVPLAALLFERLRGAVPARFLDEGEACGMNERFRCYRYSTGQHFAPHFDGCFARSPAEQSAITVLVYLNEGCGGGETRFNDYETDVVPKRGMALLFQHVILHEGRPVTSGSKYVLRTDVMYRRPGS